MKTAKPGATPHAEGTGENLKAAKPGEALSSNIGDSIDFLVEYLADNNVKDIHPLIMGEVEKRLIIKALEKSRGNKLQAAKLLGMSRNTFHRKVQKLEDAAGDRETEA